MPIRAVIFDVGGVLLRTEDRSARRAWERRFGLPEWGLADLVFGNPVARRASVGRASADDAWAEVARRLSLGPAELRALQADFWRGDAWDADLLEFVRSLRPRLKTGVLSNAWPGAREANAAHVNPGLFDVIVYSGEEGMEKPDPEIYRRALARLGVGPAEAVFVDDVAENVAAARAVGMRGVQFQNPAQAIAEIRQHLDRHSGT